MRSRKTRGERKSWENRYKLNHNYVNYCCNLQLVVVASDNQSKPKSTEITLNVKVTDRNEHKPMFTYPDSDRMTFYVQPGQEEPILTLKV